MSNIGELAIKFHNWKHGVHKHKAALVKTANPLRAGVLAAAAINWTAFFDPIDTHPDIVLKGVAARSLSRAQAQIAQYKLQDVKAYGSYDELLADPEIDVVYTALPNSLHAVWAIRAMRAGKHILIEKPVAANAKDVEAIKACSLETGKVALEAMHWRLHPLAHAVRREIASREYGDVQSFTAKMSLPRGVLAPDDLRLNYEMGGGTCMDFCYLVSSASFFCDPNQDMTLHLEQVNPRLRQLDANIDEAMDARFTFESADKQKRIRCDTHGDLVRPKLFGFIPTYWDSTPNCTIELDKAQIHLSNFVIPSMSPSMVIRGKDKNGNLTSDKKTIKCAKGGPAWGDGGEEWWTSYRYQLEVFVDAVRATQNKDETGSLKKEPRCWVSLDDSARVMSIIDAMYEKAGMLKRVSKELESDG